MCVCLSVCQIGSRPFSGFSRLGGIKRKKKRLDFQRRTKKSLLISANESCFLPVHSVETFFFPPLMLFDNNSTYFISFSFFFFGLFQRPVPLEEDRGESSHDLADGRIFFPPASSSRGKNNTRLGIIIRLAHRRRDAEFFSPIWDIIIALADGFLMALQDEMPRWRVSREETFLMAH